MLSGDASTWPPLPLKVQVLYNGEMKEITQPYPTQWTGSWPYFPLPALYDPTDYYSSNGLKYAVFQLTLEFKDTSFAERERQVLTHLSKLLENQSLSDVTFVVKNEKISAHSSIVVSGSPVICAMLEKDKFKEGHTKTVQVEDIEPSVFKEMLRYLYTVKVCKLDAMTEPLFLAADKYQIEALLFVIHRASTKVG